MSPQDAAEVARLTAALNNGPVRRMEQDGRLGRGAERSDMIQAKRYVGLIYHITSK